MTGPLTAEQKTQLLTQARYAIEQRLSGIQPVPLLEHDPVLNQTGASFVTLTQQQQLRGCIGALQAYRPLIQDVNENAQSAAFNDPRFPPVTAAELTAIHIEISVLSPLQPLQFGSEAELLHQIQPFKDGLVLQEGRRSGTFLPLVWDKLPDKTDFLRQLKVKAGLRPDYWSRTLQCFRYHTEIFEEEKKS